MRTYESPVCWMLTWFDKHTDTFVGEVELHLEDEDDVRRILRIRSDLPLIGEHTIEEEHRNEIERLSGLMLNFSRFEYFLGAVSA